MRKISRRNTIMKKIETTVIQCAAEAYPGRRER